MTVGQRVVARLRKEHGLPLPDDTVLVRTYAGWAMRANGAWSWHLWSATKPDEVSYGSQFPATTLLRCKAWEIYDPPHSPDKSIDPCLSCQQRGR